MSDIKKAAKDGHGLGEIMAKDPCAPSIKKMYKMSSNMSATLGCRR